MATAQQLQNRKRLIEALRAEMPEHFRWDFGTPYERLDCGTVGCAMGLARHIGIIEKPHPGSSHVALMPEAIGISDMEARHIFDFCDGYSKPYEGVTPQMVADKLEAI